MTHSKLLLLKNFTIKFVKYTFNNQTVTISYVKIWNVPFTSICLAKCCKYSYACSEMVLAAS